MAFVVTSVTLTFLERVALPDGTLMGTCSGGGDNYPKEIPVPLGGRSIGENLLQQGENVVYFEVTPNHPGIIILLPHAAESGIYSWSAELGVRVGTDNIVISVDKGGRPFVTMV